MLGVRMTAIVAPALAKVVRVVKARPIVAHARAAHLCRPRRRRAGASSWSAWAWRWRSSPPTIDETPQAGEKPADYARRVAAAKCDAVADRLAPERSLAVLGADTTVIIEDAILGKPADADGARAMLGRLMGGGTRWSPPTRCASARAASTAR